MQWISVDPGMPENITTQDDTYVSAEGEASFDHAPTNAELNALYSGRIAAINNAIKTIRDTISYDFASNVSWFDIINALLGDNSFIAAYDAANYTTYRTQLSAAESLLS